MDILKEIEKKMQQAIQHLNHELKGLRTNRANPAILDSVLVEVYGTKMRLQDLAIVSVPESRQLLLSPYDKSNVHHIAKGVNAANLSLQAVVEGDAIRITIPEMDPSIRQDMVKQTRRKCEEAKVSIRNARREGNEEVKQRKVEGDIPEDVMKKLEKDIQKLTDKYCQQADTYSEEKEKEIVTI